MKNFTPYFKQGILLLALCWVVPMYALQFETERVTCSGPDAGNDGKATVIIAGGQAPYSIVWSNGDSEMNFTGTRHTIENLAPGNYSVSVTDSDNCISIGSVEVKSEVEVNVTGGGTRTVCQGDPVRVTLSASTTCSTCNFLWSTGATSSSITVSSSGTYSCTVSSPNGACMDTDQTSVNIRVRDCDDDDDDDIEIPIAHAVDPNDILGPDGVGPNRWISVNDEMNYKIRFENDPEFANAPAQIVKINCPIDSNLNIFSLELGSFGFGDFNFQVPPNSTFYQTQVDVSDSLGVKVNFTAGLDVTKNEVFWIFESVDPITGLPPSALLGFLPVNDTSTTRFNDTIPGQGEGYVNFTIKPKLSAVTGDTIFEDASIVFDVNAPIVTPTIFNRIDADNPSSMMTPSMATVDTAAVTLNWTGSDVGSGNATYILYASENNGPFEIAKDSISGLTYTFEGTAGNSYDFFTIARDSVGNLEPLKTSPEESVIINGELDLQPLTNYCAGDSIEISWISGGITNLNLYYSLDSGMTYTIIDSMITASSSNYTWGYPTGVVGDTDVLIRAVSGALSDTSAPFLVRSLLVNAGLDTVICAGDTVMLGGMPTAVSQSSLTYEWKSNFMISDTTVANPFTYTNTSVEYILTVSDTFGCAEIDTVQITVNNVPGIIYSKTNVNCSGDDDGTVNLTLSNGVAPYSVLWSDGDTARTRINVPAGNYSVTVEDVNGCSSSQDNINIFDIYFSGISAGQDQTICLGDTVEIGGSPTFYGGQGTMPVYSWTNVAISDASVANPNVYPTSSQEYIVTVTDSVGCVRTDTMMVTVVNPPVLNPTVTDVSCSGNNDGSIALNISSGTMPYSILWSDGDTARTRIDLIAGDYEVTVTDANNCTVLDTNLTINESATFTVELGADLYFCMGDSVQLSPMVSGGTAPYIYDWEGDSQLSDTTIAMPYAKPLEGTPFFLKVTDANGCTALDTVSAAPTITPYITQTVTDVGCNGADGTVQLSIVGGATPYSILWNDGNMDASRTGLSAGTYFVTVTDANNCSSAADTIILNQLSGVSDTTYLTATSCDPNQVGLSTMTFTAQNGCDSLVITTTTLLQSDTTYINLTSCNQSDVGVSSSLLTNQDGCDSLVITTVTFSQSDTTMVAATTCNPSQVGVVNNLLTNQFGCDSLVITTTTLLQSDTTYINLTTCDPNQIVTQVLTYTNQSGCDSLVITNVEFAASDTTYINLTSCNSADVGMTSMLLQNQGGCDSLVITTVSFAQSDTTIINLITTNPADVGTTTQLLTNQFNCDSLIIINTTLLVVNDTTYLSATSCDLMQIGMDTTTMMNQNGGDSLIITTTTLLPSDTTYLTETTCLPSLVGVNNMLLTNQFGCDSLVITTTTLLASDTTYINLTTCNPTMVGMMSNLMTNQDGCDSLVITTTALIAADTTYINLTSCNSVDVGTTSMLLQNQGGCDSLVITTITFSQSDTTYLANTTCTPSLVGVTSNLLTNQFNCDSLVITTTTLLAGDTTYITNTTCDPNIVGVNNNLLTNQNGCDSLVITMTTLIPSDTTYINLTSCNLTDVGMTSMLLQNQGGCDSLVITTVTFSQSDTTYLTETTCLPSLVGVTSNLLTNQFNCDSLVITTTTLLTSDTTYLTNTSCDPNQVGVVSQTLMNQNGCDSLVIATTMLLPSSTMNLVETICQGDSYTVGTSVYTTSGTYTDVLTSSNGCDSTVNLTLMVNPSPTTNLVETICQGDSYTVGTSIYTTSGTYTDVLTSSAGCDSTVNLTLTVNLSPTTNLVETICQGDSYTVGTSVYTTSGTYTDILTSSAGCDSTVNLTLTVNPSPVTNLVETICQGDSYTVGTSVYTTSGIYTDVLTSSVGCDSTVNLTLMVNPSPTTNLTQTICQGDSYTVGTSVYTTSGSYTDVLTSSVGCDSTVNLTLTVNPSPTTNLTQTICQGDSYTVGTSVYTTSGSYTDVLTSSAGCDSTVILNLIVNPSPITNLTETICGGSYTVGNSVYTTSGVYTNIFQTSEGCDSTVILDLTVNPTPTTTLNETICDGDSYSLGNSLYTTAGTYTNILQTSVGCDSTVILNLMVNPIQTTTLNETICEGDSFVMGGGIFTMSGTYFEVLTTWQGCDSTVILNLTVNPSPTTNLTETICGGSYTVGDSVYTTSGIYTNIFQTSDGCDSTVILDLTVNPTPTTILDATICDGDSYSLGNSLYTTAGTYTNILQTSVGCDSTVILNLMVNPIQTTVLNETICEGDSFMLAGVPYTIESIYTLNLLTWQGCDSIITLNLTVNPSPTTNLTETICEGDSYTVGNSIYTTSGTYTDVLTSSTGCDSTVNLTLTVNLLPLVDLGTDTAICIGASVLLNASGGDSYTWQPTIGLDNANIATPTATPMTTTTYFVTVTNNNGCQTTDSITIVVNPLPMINAGADTSLCIGDTIQLNATGGVSYSWPPLPQFSNPSIANPLVSPTVTTQYIMTGTDANGCQNVDTILIVVNALPVLNITNDTSICIGESIQLEALGADGYTWMPGGSLSDSTIANPIASPTATTTYIVRGDNLTGCNSLGSVTVVVNDLPIVDAGLDTAICIGDSVLLNATSIAATNYNWTPNASLNNPNIANPTASPSATTTYTVAVTDINGCVGMDSVTVVVNPLPNITAGVDTIICAAQSVQLNAQGGVSYNWMPNVSIDDPILANPTVNPLVTTTYTVEGTDVNGCKNIDSAVITVNPLPIVNVTSDTIVCLGDTIQITATGGLTYLWTSGTNISNVNIPDPFFFPTDTSIYSVQVTDINGCQSSGSFQINVIPTPAIQASNDTSICLGQTVQLNATGGQVYTWTPSAGLSNDGIADPFATPLMSTVYTVLGVDNDGCFSYDSTYIEVFQTTQPTIVVSGDSLMATGVTNPTGFRWFLDGVPIFGANNALLIATVSGEYIVEVTDSNGCAVNSMPYDHIHTNTNTIQLTDLAIQPNPAYDYVDIKFTMPRTTSLRVIVRDVVGRVMYEEQHSTYSGIYDNRLDLSRFGSGMYVVQLVVDGQVRSEKLVVAK